MADTTSPDFISDAEMAQEPVLDARQPAVATTDSPDFIPDDEFISDEEKYGTTEQEVKAFVEGAAEGLVGPLAPLIETKLLGVKPEDIRARAKESPIAHGVGEATALTAGMLTGTGVGGVMVKAGQLATKAAGLSKVAEGASLGYRVGHAAVQQAAEMAALQSIDEVSRRIVQDPDTSAESALTNIGMAAALGAGGGALLTGAVSPLWSATAGPKVESMLNMVKNHVNGGSKLIMPEAREAAIKELGIEINPALRAALSDDFKMRQFFSDLRRGEHKEVLESLNKLNQDASDQVMKAFGLHVDDVAVSSEAEMGQKLLAAFDKEYKAKYGPIAEALDKRNAEAALIGITDDARLTEYSRLIEQAMKDVGTDSPYYKIYDDYAQRMLAKETVGGIDMLKTEINNRLKGLRVGGDYNEINALTNVKNALTDFQESQIAKMGRVAEREGVEAASKEATDLINQRAEANRQYAEFAKMSDELANNLSIGSFKGAGRLTSKLTEGLTPEEVLRKFSIKGNAEFIPFLAKHFPDTLKEVQAAELTKLLRPAVLAAKGDNAVAINKLSSTIERAMAGQKEYVTSVVPEAALKKLEAAKTIMDSIPSPRDSGTPAGMSRIFRMMPASALAAVGWLTGHNPIVGALLGETSTRVGMAVPQAYKLAYLRFMGADQPVKSEGFKAMVDFINSTYRSENAINRSIKNVFKSGAQVLAKSQIPSERELEKLDKAVDDIQRDPQNILAQQDANQVGYYLPGHQAAISKTIANVTQYLANLKPKPFKAGPLDKEIPPSPEQMARYNRALAIAQSPVTVLAKIKEGSLQISDIEDLKTMYPGLYDMYALKLSNEIATAQSNEEIIPYKTKMSMSLFLGQPLDSSMQPSSIMSAQPKPQPAPAMPQKPKPSKLNPKDAKSYMTPTQSSEARKGVQD